jgi:inorganic pyrophosphatase
MHNEPVSTGKNPPNEINVIVENPVGGEPVKYELDKDTGRMIVDRFLNVAMRYPGNYGFIPNTLSEDGDPVDVLIIGPTPVMPGAVVAVRPIGVLLMEDESGQDEKIIAIPAKRLNPYNADVKNYTELPKAMRKQIEHFFKHYKDLEKNKWVKMKGYGEAKKARRIIKEGIERAANASAPAPGSQNTPKNKP